MRGKPSLWGWGWILALLAVGCGGSSPDRSEELRALLEEAGPEEVLSRVELYRRDGERGPWLDYAEGMAQLAQNADRPAQRSFEAAVAADSSLASPLAERYRELAMADYGRNWRDRAARRMREAHRWNPGVELGPLADPVADLLYRYEKDYVRAYPLYRRLAEELPGPPPKQQEWVYRHGYCLQQNGFPDAALQVYREYVRRWPDDTKTMRYVQWRLMQLLLEESEALLGTAQPDAAMARVEEAMRGGWHPELQQRCRMTAGRIEEARGNPRAAVDWYRQVVEQSEAAGGEVVEDAKQSIERLATQGIH